MNATDRYAKLLKEHIHARFRDTFRDAGGALAYPFLTPGSSQYDQELWDWDSWLTDIAVAQALADLDDEKLAEEVLPYERGCVQNFIAVAQKQCKWLGHVPVRIGRDDRMDMLPEDPIGGSVHKPCLAQHAAFLAHRDGGDLSWLREMDGLYTLQALLNFYNAHRLHPGTGLYRGGCTGVDDDPTTHGRPPLSTAPVFLNLMMARELEAMIYLLNLAKLDEVAQTFERDLENLKAAIQAQCWDERDGYFYSVDVHLSHPEEGAWEGAGRRRHWEGLLMRIGVWTGFAALWSGVATKEQAQRLVEEHYRNEKTFNCPAGIRTLSKMEKMYLIRASGNPSCWLGPVWGIANYLVWRGLVRYGFEEDARQLCDRTIDMFGRGLEQHGQLFEYYQPSNGEPILNPGFQNWNQLVLSMIAWRENRPVIHGDWT